VHLSFCPPDGLVVARACQTVLPRDEAVAHDAVMRIGRRDVKLTNLDKLFFPGPGLTKGDLVSYYVDVADCVLHHVRRKPMHMALRFAKIL
jgi:bifunctional non-homologous end joining protein LigD